MLRKLRPRSVYDVMAAIGCFAALTTGSAYAANTVFSTDIVDGEVKTADIGNGEVKSTDVKDQSLTTFDVSTFLGADIVDGSLTAKDVGENAFFDFVADIGVVLANDCKHVEITGVAAQGDHMLLTPHYGDASSFLIYGIEYDLANNNAHLKACNPTNGHIDDGNSHFNLLVFQH